MKDWQRIRMNRPDITDYVIHFTKSGRIEMDGELRFLDAKERFIQILHSGHLQPTFAALRNRYVKTPRNTVKGPMPAVCFIDAPLWAIVKHREVSWRYSGYGIAYHKYFLHQKGAAPVIYGSENRILGVRLKEGDEGYEREKDIFKGGLPAHLQHLFVNYSPDLPEYCDYPVDFTWEREWRLAPLGGKLPVVIEHHFPKVIGGALIVERDRDVNDVRSLIEELAKEKGSHKDWPKLLRRIVSLETVAARYPQDERYGRIETWPDE